MTGSKVRFVFGKVGATRKVRRAWLPSRGGPDYWQVHKQTGMSI